MQKIKKAYIKIGSNMFYTINKNVTYIESMKQSIKTIT